MNTYIPVQRFILILILNSLCRLLYSQPVEEVLSVANNQYQKGNNDFALKEFQRYLFFEPSASNAVIYYNIGNCYWNLNQFNQASEFYDKAFFTSADDSMRIKSLFRKVDCNIRTGDYGIALNDLLSLNDSLKGNNYYLKEFYCGLCYYGMQDFNNSEFCFINAVDTAYKQQRNDIKQLFKNKKKFYLPNAQTAKVMSMFLPGLGQLYSGDIKNSANSLILTSLLAYFGFQIAYAESIFDAVITIAPWFQRYYQGGYTRAEQTAILKCAERRNRTYIEITKIISSTK